MPAFCRSPRFARLLAVALLALGTPLLGAQEAKTCAALLVAAKSGPAAIEAMGRKLHLPSERVVVTVDRHANTSAASIPLALAEARRDGRIAAGDLVVMEAIGGGLTWGAALARF